MRKEEPGVSAHLPWFSKNAVALGAVAALSVGVLAACSGSSSSSSTPTSTGSAASASTAASPSTGTTGTTAPIKIGISLSLTGDFQADGVAFDQGYKLWAKDVNAAGGIMGRQVALTILNDNSSATQVVTNYDTLISADHVDLTFGPFSSLLTTPASAVAARYGYAFIEGAGGAPTVFDTQSNEADHNTFDTSLPIADEMLPFINYVKSLPASELKGLTAAYPMAQDPFADPPVQLAQTELTAAGVKEVYSNVFPAEPSDYQTQAGLVASKHPSIVVLGSTDVPTVQAFMKVFQQQNYTPKLFIAASGPDQGAAFIKAVGAGNAAGMMVPNGWYPGFQDAASLKMVGEYVKQYGGTPSGVNADVAEAYSVGQVAEAAIKATGGVDNASIIKYLHSGVPIATVQGNVLFNSLGENTSADAFTFQWNATGTNFLQVLPAGKPGTKPIIGTKPAWSGAVG
jgi:branched-chain amino acid transport system substrate-binding protein